MLDQKSFWTKEIWLKTELSFRKIAQRFLIKISRQLTTHTDGQSSLVKMGLVSVEIFNYIQTRTNVVWTYVDGTYVPKTVDNSYRWPNHPTFKVWLSFDQ